MQEEGGVSDVRIRPPERYLPTWVHRRAAGLSFEQLRGEGVRQWTALLRQSPACTYRLPMGG